MIEFTDPVEAQVIPELMIARRAFPKAQELFAGPVLREVDSAAQVGWHDTEVTEAGALAVVPESGALSDLVGEVVVVKRDTPTAIRGIYVYVVGTVAQLPDDISLSRRAFFDLGLLSKEFLTCSVGVIA